MICEIRISTDNRVRDLGESARNVTIAKQENRIVHIHENRPANPMFESNELRNDLPRKQDSVVPAQLPKVGSLNLADGTDPAPVNLP